MTFLKRRPKLASQYCAAMDEAIDFMHKSGENPQDNRGINETGSIRGGADGSPLGTWKIGETNFESVQKYLDFLVAHGILKTETSARNLYIDATEIK